MAYKMAYEVVVCKKQNGSIALLEDIANRAMRRQRVFWTVISSQTIFLRLLGTFAAPPPHRSQLALHTAMPQILFCVKAHWRDSQKASPHEPLPPPAGPQFQTS